MGQVRGGAEHGRSMLGCQPGAGGLKGSRTSPLRMQKMALFQPHGIGRWSLAIGALFAIAAFTTSARADDKPPALGWTGQIALGGSLATGNTDREALDADTKFQLQSEHRQDVFKALGDFARENGIVTSERVEASAQTNYDISKDKFYVLGFTHYTRDHFSGFDSEFEIGPGVGYRFFHTDSLTLSVELSTGYYNASLTSGPSHENEVFTRGTANVEYKISDTTKLANEALVTGYNERVNVEDTISVTSTLIRKLATRISINARYNTDPPPGVHHTDTLSKISLVYAF